MDRPRIFAKNINNLTDARYFAAMGVDYIGFDLSPNKADHISLDILGKLKEWLEGPTIMGCFTGKESEETLTKYIVDGSLEGLYFEELPPYSILEKFSSLELFSEITAEAFNEIALYPHINAVVDLDHLKAIEAKTDHYATAKDLMSQGRLYVKGAIDESFFESAIYGYKPGLILMGGEEEKVGVKSFEELDSLFELLQ